MGPPYLKWVDSLGEERTYPLHQDEIVVGRKADADVVFSDPYVSRASTQTSFAAKEVTLSSI